ncbi:MAG: pyruvate kinase [Oscillospiraceae bacterium]|nr:pyruvate kinase [Oscillospiraceae bacterium]
MRKTKIVCTLGPASDNEETIRAMLLAGMDVARLNFSHGTHESHGKTIARFRQVRDELDKAAAVLLDTKGPEIRVGNFADGQVALADGAAFTLTTESLLGDAQRASVTYGDLPRQLQPGARLLLDDGRLSLLVRAVEGTEIRCQVEHGGLLKDHKSINIPGAQLEMPYLSEQDKADLLFGIAQEVDFVAASFVRRKEDVIALRRFLNYHAGHDIRIISKIENIEGIENFHEILEVSDGIMVARGDMGVEVAYERLPGLQKKFIRACYRAGKMVITATQMLESMVANPSPTRAEITDVANAVFDGTSAVMLSGESAAGAYPVRAVEVMAKIAEQAEADCFAMSVFEGFHYDNDGDTTNAICDATCTTARDIHAAAIIAVTKSGQTARRMSKFRPYEPIVAATPKLKTFHQLSLSWGVYPVLAQIQSSSDALFRHAVDCAQQIDMVKNGDLVVITAGIPLGTTGTTNILKVATVGSAVDI